MLVYPPAIRFAPVAPGLSDVRNDLFRGVTRRRHHSPKIHTCRVPRLRNPHNIVTTSAARTGRENRGQRYMRPSEVTLNFGTPQDSPRTSSDFEEIPYPHHWPSSQGQPEELPLHYMSEETTRRRVHQHPEHQPQQGPAGYADYAVGSAEQDDGGKDVYAKMRQSHGGLGGGRPRRLPPPPPTSVVRPSTSGLFFRSVRRHRIS